MRRVFLVVLLLVYISATSPPVTADDTAEKAVQEELKWLQGTWELTDLVTDGTGNVLPRVIPKETKLLLTIQGNNYTMTVSDITDITMERGILRIDPGASGSIQQQGPRQPSHFDTTQTEGTGKGETTLGIYQRRGDVLIVCSARSGKERPSQFASTPGSGLDLATYHRVQKPAEKHLVSHWQAVVQGPPAIIRFVLNLEVRGDRLVSGTLDIPDFRKQGLPLTSLQAQWPRLSFASPSKENSFEGEVTADGPQLQIRGNLKFGGQSAEAPIPLVFVRLVEIPPYFNRPQEPQGPLPYQEEEVIFENHAAGIKLAGTLTRPKVDNPVAAVVLVSMSGPQDRDETEFGHKPFLVLADYLTRQGVAVLRYDDRGIGKSTGSFLGSTTADFAGDARAAIDYLKTRKEINPGKIGLLGHSEGGVIVPMVAAKSPDVAFAVLVCGSALPGAATALIQTPLMLQTAGNTEKQIRFNMAIQEKFIDILKQEKDDAAAAEKMRQAVQQEFDKLDEKGKEEVLGIRKGFEQLLAPQTYPWHRFFLQHDPRPDLAKISCPVLALFGEHDVEVPPKAHMPEMEKALRAGGNRDVTITQIPQANHMLQKSASGGMYEYCAIPETMAPEALELIGNWIRQKTDERKAQE